MHKAEALRRVGNLRQLGGTRHYRLADGRSRDVAAIDVDTGTGFVFTVLPDRGLDISCASYKGHNLVYLTPNGEVHPSYHEPEGNGWLRGFFGGLVTTCGLTHLGHPVLDGDEALGLHGRFSSSPARQVCDRSRWEGDRYVIEITGVIEDAFLFGPKIRLTRSIRTAIGQRSLVIEDRVENFGYRPCPFTILYHINPGYPLLDTDARLVVNGSALPFTDETPAQVAACRSFSDPVKDFKEEVFLHDPGPDAQGRVRVGFINRKLGNGVGLAISYDKRALPYLNQWKMLGEGDYVVGIEPANVPVRDRVTLRGLGILPLLEPGETRLTGVEIAILDGHGEIDSFVEAHDHEEKGR
jgi:hypothetical protein